jgi:hypothetical protein
MSVRSLFAIGLLGLVWAGHATEEAAEAEATEAVASGAEAQESEAPAPKSVTVRDFTLSYTIEDGNLVASVSYPTTGWVSVGLGATKKMRDANIIIGYAGEDGESVVQDHFGVKPTRHEPDTAIGGKNDLIEGSCEEKDGKTTLSFTIPMDSGDLKDVKLVEGKEVKVIFAAGRNDNIGGKHSKAAWTTITL